MKNLTDITIILDRSGSMQTIASETIQGFNTFLKEQKSVKDSAKLTLIQFDHEYEILYNALDLNEALPLTKETYIPRGLTALLDAVGKTIKITKKRISKIRDEELPPKVIILIITDGHENNSKFYNRTQIFKKISNLEKKHNWQFVFLGANQDAIAEASFMGIPKSRAMTFSADAIGVVNFFDSVSENFREVRENDVQFMFNSDQRKKQQKHKNDQLE